MQRFMSPGSRYKVIGHHETHFESHDNFILSFSLFSYTFYFLVHLILTPLYFILLHFILPYKST